MFQQRFARPSPRNSDIDEWTSPPPLNDDELEEMLPMAVDGPIILETNSGCSVTLSAQSHPMMTTT